MVRFLVPLRRTASIKCSGTPHRPKPPTRMVAPSASLAMAASAEAMRLSTADSEGRVYCKEERGQIAGRNRAGNAKEMAQRACKLLKRRGRFYEGTLPPG